MIPKELVLVTVSAKSRLTSTVAAGGNVTHEKKVSSSVLLEFNCRV